MESTHEITMPRIEIDRPSLDEFRRKNTGEDGFVINKNEFDRDVKAAEVDALVSIFKDGDTTAIMNAASLEISRLAKMVDVVGEKVAQQNVSEAKEVLHNWSKLEECIEINGDKHTTKLINKRVDPDKPGLFTQQELEVKFMRNEGGLKVSNVQISLLQINEHFSEGEVQIDLTPDSVKADEFQIVSQAGIFDSSSHSEIADAIVSATNQAAYKFEVKARALEQSLTRFNSASSKNN